MANVYKCISLVYSYKKKVYFFGLSHITGAFNSLSSPKVVLNVNKMLIKLLCLTNIVKKLSKGT